MCLKREKLKILKKGVISVRYKTDGLFNINIWGNRKYISLCVYFIVCFFGVCICVQYFFDAAKNQTSNETYLTGLIKSSSKVHEEYMHVKTELSYGLLKKLAIIIVAHDFHQFHSNSEELSHLSYLPILYLSK